MAKTPKKKRAKAAPKSTRRKTSELKQIYARVLKKKNSNSALMVLTREDLTDFFSTFVKAAFAKCVDFNVAVNAANVRHADGYFYASGLRGICEDLIVLRFLSQFESDKRNAYLRDLLNKNISEGILAQYRFFRVNNPLQPLLGAPLPLGNSDPEAVDEALEKRLLQAKQDTRDSGRNIGLSDRLIVANVARSVGLLSTYNFIYFLSSNFVHFNPAGFLKLGWTNETDKNFSFSVSHMARYYGASTIFYASLLFIGFASLLSRLPGFESVDFDKEVGELEDYLSKLHRWPEIVTFEEMNQKPPWFWLGHAMREVMRSEGKIEYGQILSELKSAFKTTA